MPALGVPLFGSLKWPSLEQPESLWLMSRCRGDPSSPAAGKSVSCSHNRELLSFKVLGFHAKRESALDSPPGSTPILGKKIQIAVLSEENQQALCAAERPASKTKMLFVLGSCLLPI